MLLIIVVIVLVIALIFSIVQYVKMRTQSNVFDRAIGKRKKNTVTMITCDYCGSVIDTARYTSCPKCGAMYGNDAEWKERYEESLPGEAKTYSSEQMEKTGKRIKRLTAALGCTVALLVSTALIANTTRSFLNYEKNEKLNAYSYDNFAPAEYSVGEDNVIMDYDGVRVSVSGIFEEKQSWGNTIKIEYAVENNSGKDVSICYELLGVNGCVSDKYSGFMYGWYKDGKTLTKYDTLYDVGDIQITEMVFDNISIQDKETVIYEDERIIRISTDLEMSQEVAAPEGETAFNKNDISIVCSGKSEDGFEVSITNDSDHDFYVSSQKTFINKEEKDIYGIYRKALPAGYTVECSLFGYEEEYNNLKDDDSVETSFGFSCVKEPSADFSTGYISLQ